MTHKDWRGGRASVFKTIGASNHVDHERADHDYYATEPKATRLLTEIEQFHHNILEPSCGGGHMAEELLKAGYAVTAYDIVDRGYGKQMDFFDVKEWNGDIITNPPYSLAQPFVQHALDIIPEGYKVAMFLKLTFLEGKQRKELFANTPPLRLWVSSSRLLCAMNGDFDNVHGSATAYGWFIWQKGFKGDTVIKWFN